MTGEDSRLLGHEATVVGYLCRCTSTDGISAVRVGPGPQRVVALKYVPGAPLRSGSLPSIPSQTHRSEATRSRMDTWPNDLELLHNVARGDSERCGGQHAAPTSTITVNIPWLLGHEATVVGYLCRCTSTDGISADRVGPGTQRVDPTGRPRSSFAVALK